MSGPPPNLDAAAKPDFRRWVPFVGAAVLAAIGIPEAGLAAGIIVGVAGLSRVEGFAQRLTKILIQGAIVLLGLRMDLNEIVAAGSSGFLFAAGTIIVTFGLGWVLGRALKVEGQVMALLSTGTAICGGSAIAAVGSVLGTSRAKLGVATGVVFILNAAALYLFPVLGREMQMSGEQFGAWAGTAVHDVSSVVGAGAAYDRLMHTGDVAVQTATIVKLSRVLWIVPICMGAAVWVRRRGYSDRPQRVPVPWFIGLFLLAAIARTMFPSELSPVAPQLLAVARRGMTAALFLIGAGLSWTAIKSVGWRPMLLGVLLWVSLSAGSLAVVRATVR